MFENEKKAGHCSGCDLRLVKTPEFKGDGYFLPDAERIDFQWKKGSIISADFCGACAKEFKKKHYSALQKHLIEALCRGIDRARDSEMNRMIPIFSTTEKRVGLEKIQEWVAAGKIEMTQWTPDKVARDKEEYSKAIRITSEAKRTKLVDKGKPMAVAF